MFKLSSIIVLFTLLLIGCTDESPTIINPPAPSYPSSGTTLVAINGNNSVQLVWGAAEEAAALTAHKPFTAGTPESQTLGLILYRSYSPTNILRRNNFLAVISPNLSSFTDTSVLNGNTYYYALVYADAQLDSTGKIHHEAEQTNVAIGAPYDYSIEPAIHYSEHIQRIFTSGCAYSGCHAPSEYGKASAHSQSSKTTAYPFFLNLTSWDEAMKGGDHGAAIIPFNAAKSHFFNHLNYDTTMGAVSSPHMSFDGFNLPLNQIQILKQWVNEGAKNDDGAVALSDYPEGKILVTNQAEDLVSIIDTKSLLVSRYIQAGVANVFTQPPKAPHNITVDRANDCYYINLVAGGKVIKFRLSDNTNLGEVSGINSPTQIAISVTGDTGYSSQFAAFANSVKMFNTHTMQLYPDSIKSSYLNKPHGVQFTPDHSELWVTGNFSDNIMVVNMADRSTTIIPLLPDDTLPPGTGGRLQPYQTTMTPNGRFVYVSCQLSGEVRVVDRDSMKVTKIIAVGQDPLILDISPDGRYVYCANRNSNSVSIIRTSDNTVRTISNVGPQPHGIKISADGRLAYVSCENVSALVPPHHPTAGSKVPGFLSVIDLTTSSVIQEIEIGAFAAGVAVVE